MKSWWAHQKSKPSSEMVGVLLFTVTISRKGKTMDDQIYAALSISIIGTGLVNWFFRTWISEGIKNAIKSEYDQKLETHKALLRSQSEIEIEKLKSQLALVGMEHQIRFSKLHEMRAIVVADTYERLKDLHHRLGEYVQIFEPAGGKPKEERRNLAYESHESFRAYFQSKLIFFPKTTADKLEKINQDLVRAFNKFAVGVEMAPQMGGNSTEKWMEVFEAVTVEIKAALGEIESEFRELLGEKS